MSDVSIQTVNTSTPNSGLGDTIYAAFNKVNNNTGNLAIAVNVIQNNYANTTLGKFSQIQVTNVTKSVIGSLYFTGGDTIYVNGSPVATSASSFSGGNVALQTNFQAITDSVSSTTGALTVTGGLGVLANVNFGNNLVVSKTLTVSGTGASSIGGTLSVAGTTDSANPSTGALVVGGGLGIGLNTHIGQGLYVGGAATIGSTLGISGDTSIASSTASAGVSSGALVVTGGVGIGGALNVGGTSSFAGDLAVAGNLSVTGNVTQGVQSLTVGDNIIDLHVGYAPATDDGKDIGLKFNYYKSGDKFAFLGWSNDTGDCEYYTIGTESSGDFSGTYGTYKGGEFWSTNSTPSSSTTTGAIRTAGGLGVAGAAYVGNLVTTGGVYWANGTPFVSSTYSNTNVTAYLSSGVSSNILPSANVSYNLGSTTAWWNNIYGTAVHATYADLAENYLADAEYEAGTVVVFGGDEEITVTSTFADGRVAGVISTEPAYLMNGACGGLPVALRGRVPTMVYGPVRKGDGLVTHGTIAGCGVSIGTSPIYGQAVFAKSLVNDDSDGPRLIEAVIL